MEDSTATLRGQPGAAALLWWPVLFGLLAMYVPTYFTLATTVWDSEEQAHGPLLLMIVFYLAWRQRHRLRAEAPRPLPLPGMLLTLFGLLLYLLGRTQDILALDVGSQIPVLAGILLVTRGLPALKALWFPLLYIVFMVPLPGFFVDAVTGSLKEHVSEVAEAVMYQAGYPVARSGVTLTVGQYELLVADACSGLNSMFSLTAMGVLYLYLTQGGGWLRNGVIIAAIIPIAFIANVARVVTLVMVTYYFGDEAGQGFVHGFAGVLLFGVALLSLFALDIGLSRLVADRARGESR